MSKKGYTGNETENECPICGSIIWGRGQRVLIEGARITVCQSCAQHGTKVTNKPSSAYSINKVPHTMPYNNKPKTQTKPKVRAPDPTDDIEIITDYADRIKNARMTRNLNQDQFAQKLNEKPSLLRRIEAGKAKPTLKLAKKIEQVYNIALLEKTDKIEVNTKKYMKRQTGSSLGDIALIKKKK